MKCQLQRLENPSQKEKVMCAEQGLFTCRDMLTSVPMIGEKSDSVDRDLTK